MKKGVHAFIVIILFILSLGVVLLPMWKFANGGNISLVASAYGELPMEIELGVFEPLAIVGEDTTIDSLSETDITLTNKNGFDKTSQLYVLIEKNSTIPYMYVRTSINGEEYNLNKIELEEDEDNFYFYLGDVTVPAYGNETLKAKLWLSPATKDVDENSTLVINYIVR